MGITIMSKMIKVLKILMKFIFCATPDEEQKEVQLLLTKVSLIKHSGMTSEG